MIKYVKFYNIGNFKVDDGHDAGVFTGNEGIRAVRVCEDHLVVHISSMILGSVRISKFCGDFYVNWPNLQKEVVVVWEKGVRKIPEDVKEEE